MPRGGRRPGAGHPGGPNKRSRKRVEFADKAREEGISPLEVMLAEMRALWAKNTDESRKQACEIAKDAASYVHPRLQAVDMTNDQLVQHVVRVPPKSASVEQWISDYIETPPPTVQ